MAKMTIEEVEALFTPEVMERIVNRIMQMLDLKEQTPKYLADGGCQMPKTIINGYCAVCGSPNRTCQPEKQRTKG